jgi:DNA-binding NtrC family response regulator
VRVCSASVSAAPADKGLLIVDDRADVRRSLTRFFAMFIQRVHHAGDPDEAEQILIEHRPELLLCDYWLGTDQAPGTELARRWRRVHGCLRRVAIMTGTKTTAIVPPPGVDRVFQKPLPMDEVREWLLAD